MVRLAREDLVRAKELLEQDDLGELVGQRERPEGQPVVAVELQADELVVDPHLLPHLLEPSGGARVRSAIVFVLIAYALAILALAGPAWRQVPQPQRSRKSGETSDSPLRFHRKVVSLIRP